MKKFVMRNWIFVAAMSAVLFSGCASLPNLFNFGDGKILGVIEYRLPSGALPTGETLPAGATITDVLLAAGVDLATTAMKDKWNVRDVIQDVDANGDPVTQIVTDYGTFTLATGDIMDSVQKVWFAQDGDALQIKFEDAGGDVQTGTIE